MAQTSTPDPSAAERKLAPEALPLIAAYFQVLAEPARLNMLNILRTGERNVGELAEMSACSVANTSRHLALLAQNGLITRKTRGNSVYYSIEDQAVFALCDLVCSSIVDRLSKLDQQRQALLGTASAST